VREEAQLLACFVEGALLFLRMDLPDLVFGNSLGDAGVGSEDRSKNKLLCPEESPQRDDCALW
jgi:hypothetical protein